jgi:hypothetical protein
LPHSTDRRVSQSLNEKAKSRRLRFSLTLKALSALRIWKLHERNPWKRLELVAKACGYKGCRKAWDDYNTDREQGFNVEPMSNRAKAEISGARKDALTFFQSLFPSETPSNFWGFNERKS